MNILIGGAWPYANGSLHIGHIAGLLPGDVLARYYRQKGDDVCYVSGSDCHGTPIAILGQQENKPYEEVYGHYHREFVECFNRLGFTYDNYGYTGSKRHFDFVTRFHEKLYESPSICEKACEQAYCEGCGTFLTDRFVNGFCPECHKEARGDQCDYCGAVLEAERLENPVCAVCGDTVVLRWATHLYISLSDFEKALEDNIDTVYWRKNAVAFTRRYIEEGLPDKALTRELPLGIPVPRSGYEDKKIYIWAENVLGYLSGCDDFASFYQNEDALHYYVHGKDNIPFHTIILPAMLLAHGEGYHLPDRIISSEYMTLDGAKISTSRNHAVWILDLLDKYNPDSIRSFFIANAPEKRDADFTFREFIYHHNSQLVGIYGNFINRTLVFINKYFSDIVPEGVVNTEISENITDLYATVGREIELGNLKNAHEAVINLARFGNKYFDTNKPWETRTTNPTACRDTIFNCVQIIANTAVLLEPFTPFSSGKVCSWLNIDNSWEIKKITGGYILPPVGILFERIRSAEAL